jgi:hypothetical protein
MVPFLGMVVNRPCRSLTFIDTLVLFKEFQRTVNGRFIDTRVLFMNIADNFFRRKVLPFIVDIFQDSPARPGKP